MGGRLLEADAGLARLTAPGVVQFEAAMVEVLAACCQRHEQTSLLALHAVSCYPTRLISPAAQRRAMLLGPRWRGESGRSSAVAVGLNHREHHDCDSFRRAIARKADATQAWPRQHPVAAPRRTRAAGGGRG